MHPSPMFNPTEAVDQSIADAYMTVNLEKHFKAQRARLLSAYPPKERTQELVAKCDMRAVAFCDELLLRLRAAVLSDFGGGAGRKYHSVNISYDSHGLVISVRLWTTVFAVAYRSYPMTIGDAFDSTPTGLAQLREIPRIRRMYSINSVEVTPIEFHKRTIQMLQFRMEPTSAS